MNPIRIGIIGSGFMGLTHAAAVRNTSSAELAAVSGGRRAAALAARFSVEHIAETDALLSRSDIDAVVIATPHHLHASQTLAAFAAGKHVLVEKPMATSLADCDAMISAATAARAVLAVGFQQRFRVNNSEARHLIQQGAIGQLLLAHVSMLPSFAPMLADGSFGGSWEWWSDPRSLGHIINAGPHAIDLLRWAFALEIESVSAVCRSFRPGSLVEDTTAALLTLSNGAVCTLNSSLLAPAPSFPGEQFRFRFLGSEAIMDLDPYAELRLSRNSTLATVSVQPEVGHQSADTLLNASRMAAYNEQMACFVQAIDGKPSEIATAEDGRAAVEVCLAMLESSHTGSLQHLR